MGKIIKNGIEYSGTGSSGASSADKLSYDNTSSGLEATNVQGAIDEVKVEIDNKVDTTDSRLTDARTPKEHDHDDKYYTETEIDNKFNTTNQNVTNNANAITQLNSNIDSHTSNKSNPHGVTKAQVGLGNVDNTADSAKSVKYATSSGSANAVAWDNVSGKPSSFTPSSHTHDDRYYTESEINTKLQTKQDTSSAITTSNISSQSVKYAASAGAVAWGNVSGKPSTYAPSSHTHSYLPLSGNNTVNGSVDFTGSIQAQYFYGLDNADARVTAGSSKNNIVLLGAGIGCYNTGMTANVPIYASAFTVSSSKHVKENILDMTEEEANKILDVNIISFDYKENFGGNKNNFGVIAEDVKEIIPTVVNVPNDYTESLFDESKGINQPIVSVDYSKFVPYLIKMVQIQQSKINELEERLSKLEK